MEVDTSQYLSMFLEESIDNLQTLNESLLQLEQQPDDVDKLNEIFRVAHTIKGMAATMGFNEMAELTHKMEDVLSEFREGKLKVTQKVVTVLFKCLDTLEQMVNNISEEIDEEVPIEEIINDLHSISEDNCEIKTVAADCEISKSDKSKDNNSIKSIKSIKERMELNEYDINVIKQAIQKGFNSFKATIILNENTLLKSARAFLIFKSLEEFGEIIKSIPCTEDLENENFDTTIQLVYISSISKDEVYNILINISEVEEVLVEQVDIEKNIALEQQKQQKQQKNKQSKSAKKEKSSNKEVSKSKRKAHQSVRVDLERLDKFLTMVSELVIHRTRLEQIAGNLKVTDLNETLEQVGRTTSDLQELVMKIRMLPLETVFNRFPRMIRDLSVELDKEMELIIEGQDTELDRTVIDEIGEPLIHLLRNSADHGIESREERIAKGKDPVGKIKLIAYPEGTKAVIKVEDDGAGINLEKVKNKAIEKGINIEGMNENDIKNLIFDQGFSTNSEVTDISGRGVGMDVVKTKIASLGGTVELLSEEDKGTAFIVKLPLTLQIIQALLVKVGDEIMAISLGYIDRVIDFRDNLIKKTNNKEVIIHNENVIPLIRINEKLGIQPSKESKNYIVIVKVGEKTVGLLVDSLLGQQEIVIKPLGKTLQSSKEYIGATILGDGLVTLILDVAALI
jgi:two-component system, chemotaxis family, sensor kinase CheA